MRKRLTRTYMAAHYPTVLLLMDRGEDGEAIEDNEKNYKVLHNFLTKEGFAIGPWSFEMNDNSVSVWDAVEKKNMDNWGFDPNKYQ